MLSYLVASCEVLKFDALKLLKNLAYQQDQKITTNEVDEGIKIYSLIVYNVELTVIVYEYDKIDPVQTNLPKNKKGKTEIFFQIKSLCFKKLINFAVVIKEKIPPLKWEILEILYVEHPDTKETIPISQHKILISKKLINLSDAIISAQRCDDSIREDLYLSSSNLIFGVAIQIEPSRIYSLINDLASKNILISTCEDEVWSTKCGVNIQFKKKRISSKIGICMISTDQRLEYLYKFINLYLPLITYWGIYWINCIDKSITLISRSTKRERLMALLDREGFF